MPSQHWPALLAVGVLAALHVAAGSIWPSAEDMHPRTRSFAGGLTVAYVFAHVLPDLAEKQAIWLEHRPDRPFLWFQEQIYVGALIGLLIAYGIGHVTRKAEGPRFWIAIASFALYNMIIGYYVAQVQKTAGLVLAVVALGAHLLVDDHALVRDGGERFRNGRFVLAAAILVGGWLGATVDLPEPVLAVVFALLAGGIILRALNEEIPPEHEGRFTFFALGAVGYALMVLAVTALLH
jgi:hypothetical protein